MKKTIRIILAPIIIVTSLACMYVDYFNHTVISDKGKYILTIERDKSKNILTPEWRIYEKKNQNYLLVSTFLQDTETFDLLVSEKQKHIIWIDKVNIIKIKNFKGEPVKELTDYDIYTVNEISKYGNGMSTLFNRLEPFIHDNGNELIIYPKHNKEGLENNHEIIKINLNDYSVKREKYDYYSPEIIDDYSNYITWILWGSSIFVLIIVIFTITKKRQS
jgi:hypothetical protein